MWAHRPPNRPYDPTEPGAPAPKLLPSPPKVPPPPPTPKASKYSSVRQNELEELRQRGLAKLFNKHFTTVTQQIAAERAAADKALKDLEARRLSEFKETNYGATISNYDQMVLELQKKRDECKRKERETLLLYQRYVHKFGNKAGAMAVPSMNDAKASLEDGLPLPPLVTKSVEDTKVGCHVPDRTTEIETNLQGYMDKGGQRHPSIRDLGLSETYKTLQDAMEQQERDFLKSSTLSSADAKSPVRRPKLSPEPLVLRGQKLEDHEEIDEEEIAPQTPVAKQKSGTSSSSDTNADTAAGEQTPLPKTTTDSETTDVDVDAAVTAINNNATTKGDSSSLVPPPQLVASTPGSSSSTSVAHADSPSTKKSLTAMPSEASTATTVKIGSSADNSDSSSSIPEHPSCKQEQPQNTSIVTFEEKLTEESPESSSEDGDDDDDNFLSRDDHALNVSTDEDIMSAHSAVSGLTSVEIISDAEMKLLEFLRTETEAIRQMLDEQEEEEQRSVNLSSSPNGTNPATTAIGGDVAGLRSNYETSSYAPIPDDAILSDDMSETQRATLQAEEMVREMQRVLEEAQNEQHVGNNAANSDNVSTWTPTQQYYGSGTTTASSTYSPTPGTPVSVAKEPYRLETTNPNEEWMVYYDDQHQRNYYHEVNSDVVQWEKPATAKAVQPSRGISSSNSTHGDGTEDTTTKDGTITATPTGMTSSSTSQSRASPMTVRSINTTVSTEDHDYVPLKDYSKKKKKSSLSTGTASSDAGSVNSSSIRSGASGSVLQQQQQDTNNDGTTNATAAASVHSSNSSHNPTADGTTSIMSGVVSSSESQLLTYEDVMPEIGGRPSSLRSSSGGTSTNMTRRDLYRRQQRRKRNRRRAAMLAGTVVAMTASVYCKKEISAVVDVLVPDSIEYQLHHVMTKHVNSHVPAFMQWTSSKVVTKELQEKMQHEQHLKQQQEVAELRKRQENERKAQLEQERKAKVEAEKQAKLQAKLEAERKAREEAELKRKLESEIRAKLEAEQKAKEEALEAQRKAKEAAEAAEAEAARKAAEADEEAKRATEETARKAAAEAELAMEVERKAHEETEAALALLEETTTTEEHDDNEIALKYKERPLVCNVPLSYVVPGKCRRMAKAKPIYDVAGLIGSMMQ